MTINPYLCGVKQRNMGKSSKRTVRTKQDWEAILNDRFSYLPQEEREKLLKGDAFVKVPSQELKRLRIDAYPCLM